MVQRPTHHRRTAKRVGGRIARYLFIALLGYSATIAALFRDSSTGAPGYYLFGVVFLGLWTIAFYHDVRAQRHYQGSGYAERSRYGPAYWRHPWGLTARMDDPTPAIRFHQLCLRTLVLSNVWGFLITVGLLITDVI